MNLIRTIAAWTVASGCSLAAAQTETAVFQFGARTYSAAILDESRADVERRFPELGRPPADQFNDSALLLFFAGTLAALAAVMAAILAYQYAMYPLATKAL